jgi:hypothetical protein
LKKPAAAIELRLNEQLREHVLRYKDDPDRVAKRGPVLFWFLRLLRLLPIDQTVVFGMMPDPEPDEIVAIFDSDSAIVEPNPYGPVTANLFEM